MVTCTPRIYSAVEFLVNAMYTGFFSQSWKLRGCLENVDIGGLVHKVEIRYECADIIKMILNRVQWRVLMNTVMNLLVP
jgi:hypothetical protein